MNFETTVSLGRDKKIEATMLLGDYSCYYQHPLLLSNQWAIGGLTG